MEANTSRAYASKLFPAYPIHGSPTDDTTIHDSDETLSNSGRFSDRPEYFSASGPFNKGSFAPGTENPHLLHTQPIVRPSPPATMHTQTRNDGVGRLYTYNYGFQPCLYPPVPILVESPPP